MKQQIEYFEFEGRKIKLTGLESVYTSHGQSSHHHHVVNLIYEDGTSDFLFCSDLSGLELSHGGDYWISMDSSHSISLFSDKAKAKDKEDYNKCVALAEKIQAYIDKNISWVKVEL